jgi:hypothetical protein
MSAFQRGEMGGGKYPFAGAKEVIFEIHDIGMRNQFHYLQLPILLLTVYSGGVYFEPFILHDSFDCGIFAGVDESDLEDNSEGPIADDLDTLVIDVLFFFSLAINDALSDDSLSVQISYAY